ncbi:2-Hydroxyacid oxidase-like [Schistocerca gregaria]|uniref:2-Hydroxyacid oxidase-like n=1 Tax=Schistocerca gregaria TaxID=7010 RepID=UPI00211EC248|nr:2-Hydroxyacid oxidase-like [Schistocerca gregaria]
MKSKFLPLNVRDLRRCSRIIKLSRSAYDYCASGSRDQFTLKQNLKAYQNYNIIPRALVGGLSSANTRTAILGESVDFPVLIAPTSMHKLMHQDGEVATYKAALKMNTIYCMSSLATTTAEDIAKHSDRLRWFQLYIAKDRERTKRLVFKLTQLGFKALVLTIDTPILGVREKDIINGFSLPNGMRLENFEDDPNAAVSGEHGIMSGLNRFFHTSVDMDLKWSDINWLKSITNLPIILKGVMCADDAQLALDHNVAGIIVSNHGGRQLDTVPATIDVLPEIANAVCGRIPVLLDGGIRRGTDIFKALALGANAVLIGRPILWGLAYNGESGVELALNFLKTELLETMILSGTRSIDEIQAKHIRRAI